MKLSICFHFVGFQSEMSILIFSKILLKFMLSSLLQTLKNLVCTARPFI